MFNHWQIRLLGGAWWEDGVLCPLIEPRLGRRGNWERLPNELWCVRRWQGEV